MVPFCGQLCAVSVGSSWNRTRELCISWAGPVDSKGRSVTDLLETAIFVVALLVVLLAVSDLFAGWWRALNKSRDLERLRPMDDDEIEEARDGRAGAGLNWTVVIWTGVALILSLFVGSIIFSVFSVPVLAVLSGLLSVYIPWTAIRQFRQWRALRFEQDLVDAVDLMAAALEAGENTSQALVSAAEGCEGSGRRELREIAHRLDLGMSIERALQRVHRKYPVEGVRLFVQSLIAKWYAGGDLAPVLRAIARIMRDRLSIRLRTRSELAGAQASALLLALLPYVLIVAFVLAAPFWIDSIVQHPSGPALLLFGVLLQLLGFVWLWRVIRVEL